MKKNIIPPNSAEILSALHEINPFWANKGWPELPQIRRYPFYSAVNYLEEIGSQRALFLRGFRGVGKSTLLRGTRAGINVVRWRFDAGTSV